MAMKFDVPRCPVCDELAKGTLESVPGMALLMFNEQGEAEYLGETEIFWNDQVTRFDRRGRVTLLCTNGHEWRSPRHEGTEPQPQTAENCPVCKKQPLRFPHPNPTHCSAECSLAGGLATGSVQDPHDDSVDTLDSAERADLSEQFRKFSPPPTAADEP
jgi:hypothetical protein